MEYGLLHLEFGAINQCLRKMQQTLIRNHITNLYYPTIDFSIYGIVLLAISAHSVQNLLLHIIRLKILYSYLSLYC